MSDKKKLTRADEVYMLKTLGTVAAAAAVGTGLANTLVSDYKERTKYDNPPATSTPDDPPTHKSDNGPVTSNSQDAAANAFNAYGYNERAAQNPDELGGRLHQSHSGREWRAAVDSRRSQDLDGGSSKPGRNK